MGGAVIREEVLAQHIVDLIDVGDVQTERVVLYMKQDDIVEMYRLCDRETPERFLRSGDSVLNHNQTS